MGKEGKPCRGGGRGGGSGVVAQGVQLTSWWPEPNQPQGVKYMDPLAPVVALSKVKSPALSTQVRPTITLWALQLGGTRENTSPVLFKRMRVRPALLHQLRTLPAWKEKREEEGRKGCKGGEEGKTQERKREEVSGKARLIVMGSCRSENKLSCLLHASLLADAACARMLGTV